jgi:uncharacterized protein DUF2154
MNVSSVLLIGGIFSLMGCRLEHAGPVQNEFQVLERDDSESVRVTLRMGAGNLRIGSGTQKLMRADFAFNVPAWKPVLHYSSAGKRGNLRIEQPSEGGSIRGNSKYEWDIRLNREVPVDLEVHFGAGEATLDLGSLDLQSVEVHMGVGELKMDLRGRPKRDYKVRIRGGVGEAVVRLPSDVSVYADARGGIGEISAKGMRYDGGRYYNSAYGKAKPSIHLDIHGGVGSIKLISD